MVINVELTPKEKEFIKNIEKGCEWVTQEYVSLFAPGNTTDEDIVKIKVVLALMGLLHDEYKLMYDEETQETTPDKYKWEYSKMTVQDVLKEYLNNK